MNGRDGEPRSGDAEAFECFYRSNYLDQLKRAVLLLQSDAGAEDAVHDAFAEVWAKWHELTMPERYLSRCVTNRCRRLLGRASTSERVSDLLGADLISDAPDHALAEALRGLRFDHRAPLVLHYYARLSYAEIAEILDWPMGSVGPRLSSARSSLRKAIQ